MNVRAVSGRVQRVLAPLCVLLGVTAGCDKGEAGRLEGEAVGATTGAHALTPGELEALREDVRKRLAEELRPEVLAELRRALMVDAKAEAPGDVAPAPERLAADAGSEEAGPSEPIPASAAASEDIWSTPGTRIWPSTGGTKLVELVVATTLEEKLPADSELHYATVPAILYCYSVFENAQADATVTHVWRRGSRLVSRVELEVGRGPKWRTWSKQRTQPHWTGLWSCEVLGTDGRQLGLTVFQVGG